MAHRRPAFTEEALTLTLTVVVKRNSTGKEMERHSLSIDTTLDMLLKIRQQIKLETEVITLTKAALDEAWETLRAEAVSKGLAEEEE